MSTLQTREFISASEQETEAFAATLAKELAVGSVLALHGELGAGKTVFSRGFARGLGIAEPVSSPTYTIIQEYALNDGGWFFHLDLYRIDGPEAALAFGVDDYLEDPDAYAVIEWPERIAGILPPGVINIAISHRGDNSRSIVVSA